MNNYCVNIWAGRWFSLVSSTNKTDRHDITEILLKVALNIITQPPIYILHSRLPLSSYQLKISPGQTLWNLS
jgi:hypothetical protein